MKITKFIKNKKKYKTDYDIWIMGEITNLTNDQDNGLKELNKWLEDEKDLAISLTGSAGTGKTTLIKRFITDNSLYSKSICVAAPTHKAKEVISIITGIKSCATVQELIGLKVNYDIEEFDINQVNFLTDFSKIKIGNYELIFIDEASMINADLFNHIMKFSKMYHTKLLFIGDAYQINPVKEIISPVFNDIRQVVLHEIIRQKSTNLISELINLAREAVKYADDRLINFCLKHVDNEMFLTSGYNIFSDEQHTFNKFIDVYTENPDTFFIHYTNDVVVAWNKQIRKNLIQEPEPYTIYDKIVGYNTIADKDKNYILQNSIVYSITDIDHKHVILYDLQIDYYLLTIVNKGNYSKISVVKEHSLENYRRVAYHMIQQSLKQRNWKTYYNFKDTYLLDRKLEIQKGQFTDKSIDYSYCITCHKCLPLNSKILTVTGIKEIKDLNIGDEIISGLGNVRKILNKEYTGIKQQYIIKTKSGRSFISSPEHRYLMFDGSYKKAYEINQNDYLCLWRTKKEFKFEFDLDYYFYGYLVGDGCYSYNSNRIDITIMNNSNIIILLNKFFSKYNSKVHTYTKKNNKAVCLSIENKQLREQLLSIGFERVTGSNKKCPLFKTLNQKANFIRGLMDSDGSVSCVNNRIRLVNISESIIDETSFMLQEFGIIAKKTVVNNTYILSLSGENVKIYQEKIGFSLDYKIDKLIKACIKINGKSNTDFIPEELKVKEQLIKILYESKKRGIKGKGLYADKNYKIGNMLRHKYLSYNQLFYLCEYLKSANINIPENILNIYKNWYFYDKVVSFKLLNYETEMLDIEVEKDNSFIYNGVVVHNSQGSTYDNVFINMKNIIRNKNIRERNRLIYVALSRAAYGITILI